MKDATTKTYEEMLKVTPHLTDPTADSPGPGLSRFRCFFFFTYDDPELVHTRTRTWWIPNLQELYYDMDKEYSRANSKLALPRLVTEMNILRDPQQAAARFKLIASGPELSGTPMEEAEKDNEESLD